METYDRYWRVKTRLPERKGERCRVVARGKMNSCIVEFERDGYQVVTSRNYIRKIQSDMGIPISNAPPTGGDAGIPASV